MAATNEKRKQLGMGRLRVLATEASLVLLLMWPQGQREGKEKERKEWNQHSVLTISCKSGQKNPQGTNGIGRKVRFWGRRDIVKGVTKAVMWRNHHPAKTTYLAFPDPAGQYRSIQWSCRGPRNLDSEWNCHRRMGRGHAHLLQCCFRCFL